MNSNSKKYIQRAKDEAQNQLKHNLNFEAIFSIVFCLLGSVFAAFAMTGFRFDFETFTDLSFYLSVAISFGIMMYVYNFSKPVVLKSLIKKPDTEYQTQKSRETSILKYVHDWHHEELIEKAVDDENEIRRKVSAQQILDSVTYGLDVEIIENLDSENEKIKNIAIDNELFNMFVKKRGLKRRRFFLFFWQKNEVKKLRKAINKVLNGKYSYEKLNSRDLLANTTGERQDIKQMTIDSRKEDIQDNRKKIITSIISTAVINMLVWRGVGPEFWIGLLAQISLILSNVASAYMSSLKRYKNMTFVTANRNEFLYSALKEKLKIIPLGVRPTVDSIKKEEPIIVETNKDNLLTEAIPLSLSDRINILNNNINQTSS